MTLTGICANEWIRALAYASGQYRQLKNDESLDEMAERIQALEEDLPPEPSAQQQNQYRVR